LILGVWQSATRRCVGTATSGAIRTRLGRRRDRP
jgi:hypothetical protein